MGWGEESQIQTNNQSINLSQTPLGDPQIILSNQFSPQQTFSDPIKPLKITKQPHQATSFNL